MARRGDVKRVELRELQGAVEDIRYQKRDDGEHYVHDVESENELWLVDVNGKRGTLMVPRDRTPLWSKDGGTYWLNNPPRARGKRGAMATRSKARRRSTTRRKSKRPPPAGFKTWSAYMASIRPNSYKGASMAAKKRRKSSRRPAKRRRHVAAAKSNPPAHHSRRRARHHRRNPPLLSITGLLGRVKKAAIAGPTLLVGEGAARLTRSRFFGMPAGTLMGGAVEFLAGIAYGLAAEKAFGPEVGQNVTNGATAGVLRVAAKQLTGFPIVQEALGDSGGRRRFMIKGGRVIPVAPGRRLAGYVGNGQPLAGYVGNGQRLAGYDDGGDELYGT